MVSEKESMAMGSRRSKPPLHNFTLPCGLQWGNRKFLRCVKLDSNGEIAALHRRSDGSLEQLHRWQRSEAAFELHRLRSDERVLGMDVLKNGGRPEGDRKFRNGVENGIAAVRKKLLFYLQAATDKMKDAMLRTGLKDEERLLVAEDGGERPPAPTTAQKTITPVGQSGTATDGVESARPWNLRSRRSSGEPIPGLNVEATMLPNASPMKSRNKSPKHRSSSAAAASSSCNGGKREREKFSIALSKQQIEEDFAAIIGHKPPRRPKKRPKYIQKNLDTLFPGLWLTEITPEMYKVPDDDQSKEQKKRW